MRLKNNKACRDPHRNRSSYTHLSSYEGIISINYDKLIQVMKTLMQSVSPSTSFLTQIVLNLPFFAGRFLEGVAVGLKVG